MKLQSANWKRELYIGDNLAVMRGMNSETVDLIYLDPPFNSKRMYEGNLAPEMGKQLFSDIWGDSDIAEDDRRILRNQYPLCADLIDLLGKSHGVSWKSYLSFMGIRLMEMHRLLKETGGIYLHCDSRMSHPLKLIMDEIFGEAKFRNEIIWRKTNSPKAQSRVFGAQHDIILMYTKSDNFVFNRMYLKADSSYLKSFRQEDEKGRYQTVAIVAGGIQKSENRKIFDFKGVVAPWLYKKATLEQWWADGLIVKTKTGGYRKKHYLHEAEGKLVSDIWADESVSPLQGQSREKTGWATQKPPALLERVIKASSNEGDLILDPFCGCGTACVVASRIGRQWIGIDRHPATGEVMKKWMRKDTKLAPEWDGVKIVDAQTAANLPKRTDGNAV